MLAILSLLPPSCWTAEPSEKRFSIKCECFRWEIHFIMDQQNFTEFQYYIYTRWISLKIMMCFSKIFIEFVSRAFLWIKLSTTNNDPFRIDTFYSVCINCLAKLYFIFRNLHKSRFSLLFHSYCNAIRNITSIRTH